MRKLVVSEFVTLDGVMQGPGSRWEDEEGGFENGGWVPPLFDDGIGAYFGEVTPNADAILLGRKTYVSHAGAFEPDPANDPFAGTKKYVVTKTLTESLWRDTTFIREDVIGSIRALKAQPGKDILTDGSCQLVHAMLEHDLVDEVNLLIFPVVVGGGKRVFPNGLHRSFKLIESKSTPNGIVIVRYARAEN
jgi:dihydrofolate reductase